MKISPQKYHYLGLSAVIFTLIASILSLYVYITYQRSEYLYYFVFWLVVCFIDIIIWRNPPKQRRKDNELLLKGDVPEHS